MHHKRAQQEQAARRAGQAVGNAADAVFDAGDYKTALRLYLQAVHSGAETKVGHLAIERAHALQLDSVALGAGLAAMILLALAWVWALSN